MKVIQINSVYGRGSTGKITKDLHEGYLKKGIDSIVIYGRGEKNNDKRVIKVCSEFYSHMNKLLSLVTGYMYGGCYFSTKKTIKIIKKEKPDIVHLQCINGHFINIYKLVSWLKKNKIKTVLTLHAEFMYTANCGHAYECEKWKTGCGNCSRFREETGSFLFDCTHKSWNKMKKAYDGFKLIKIVSCSNWIQNRSKLSPFFKNFDNITIHNGISSDLFSYMKEKTDQDILLKYGIPLNKKIILHVTPGFEMPVKGGKYFEKLSQLLDDSYQCIVVGAKEKINEKIISIPFVDNQKELVAIYRGASVLVVTSVMDNYPTVCLEANCCGTPVVGFNVGGVQETIYPGMGETVCFDDLEQLKEKVVYWANSSIKTNIADGAKKYHDKSRMNDEYCKVYLFDNSN